MPAYRQRPSGALFARTACLTIAAFALSACDFQANPSDPDSSSPPPASAPTAPAEPGKSPTTASVTLSWSAPAQNADGTPLQDLAGYRIYYSQAPWGWTSSLNVPDPRTTTTEIPALATGTTWYFAMTSYNAEGVESERTGYVSKML